MTLFFDANLSRHLVAALSDLFPSAAHVSRLGVNPDDDTIWSYAAANGLMIVTKDSDFYRMSMMLGPPPKVVWLRVGNCSSAVVEVLIRSRLGDIEAFALDPAAAMLVINRR